MPRQLVTTNLNEQHVRAIAGFLGIKFDRSSFKAWIANKQHPDRKRIEAFGGRVFANIEPPWIWSDWANEPQGPIDGLYAVTSLSPVPSHALRQPICLDSWVNHGLRIASVNTSDEIERLRPVYPQVSKWIECDQVSTQYNRPTPLINSLLDVSVQINSPVLVINSDIEIYGDQSTLRKMVERRTISIGVRHNYELSPTDARLEPYGLDAFLLYPEVVQGIPKMEFAIGKPFWDYWLPWHLMLDGNPIELIESPLFYHQIHALNWSQDEWSKGYAWMIEHYGTEGVNWEQWRRRLSITD